jgi:hypothetical protein
MSNSSGACQETSPLMAQKFAAKSLHVRRNRHAKADIFLTDFDACKDERGSGATFNGENERLREGPGIST